MDTKTYNPTRVTILGGFLGAGKTTLLNRILSHYNGLRAAVLVNDFGALNIDAQLISSIEENGTLSLTNGCICCTIRDDLLTETVRLLQRPSPPEYIIVEASGVSNPMTIIQTFLLPELSPFIRLDSVITVVDAEQFALLTGEYAVLAFQQVAVADVVVINKTDLVDGEQRAALREKLRAFQPRIFETTHGQLPIEWLIGTSVVDRLLAQREETTVEHHSLFSTWHWSSDRPLSGKAVRRALRYLPPGLLRAKGILYLQESPHERVIIQVVGTRVSLTLGEAWGNSIPCSQIVAIGMPNSLDNAALTRHFQNAVLS